MQLVKIVDHEIVLIHKPIPDVNPITVIEITFQVIGFTDVIKLRVLTKSLTKMLSEIVQSHQGDIDEH